MLNAQELYDLAMWIEQLNKSAPMRKMLLSEGPRPVAFHDNIIVGYLELVQLPSGETVVFVPTTNQRYIPAVVASPGLSTE